jgi:hypothetical protein
MQHAGLIAAPRVVTGAGRIRGRITASASGGAVDLSRARRSPSGSRFLTIGETARGPAPRVGRRSGPPRRQARGNCAGSERATALRVALLWAPEVIIVLAAPNLGCRCFRGLKLTASLHCQEPLKTYPLTNCHNVHKTGSL